MKKGLMLSLEGINYTWKTPFAEWLKRDFSEGREVVITRDPPYFLSPWDSLVEFFERREEMSRLAEAMMLLAARFDNNERVIIPAISRGALVIADRYIDSWLAYQSVRLADYFGKNPVMVREFLVGINEAMVSQGFIVRPDLTILIVDDPERTIERKHREEKTSKYDFIDVQQRVLGQYLELADLFPDRIVRVEVFEKDIHEAYVVISALVRNWLKAAASGDATSVFPSISTIKKGDRLMALRRISWTVEEFDDYPLVVESGDTATVTFVQDGEGKIGVQFDKDEYPEISKSLNLATNERFSCIVLRQTLGC